MKKPHQISINGLMWFLLFIFNNYFKMSRRLKHFSILSKAKSTCSLVCVAINEKRIKVSLGATAGDTTGLTNTPSSNKSRVTRNVFSLSRINNGIIGVDV